MLFRICRPCAVFRVISLIVINAFKGKALFVCGFHIFNKIANIFPFITYDYSTTSIIFPFRSFWISATGYHSFPNIVKRVLRFSVNNHSISSIATATFCVSKVCDLHNFWGATTIALNYCKCLTVFFSIYSLSTIVSFPSVCPTLTLRCSWGIRL